LLLFIESVLSSTEGPPKDIIISTPLLWGEKEQELRELQAFTRLTPMRSQTRLGGIGLMRFFWSLYSKVRALRGCGFQNPIPISTQEETLPFHPGPLLI
jgi:hypothetical protein